MRPPTLLLGKLGALKEEEQSTPRLVARRTGPGLRVRLRLLPFRLCRGRIQPTPGWINMPRGELLPISGNISGFDIPRVQPGTWVTGQSHNMGCNPLSPAGFPLGCLPAPAPAPPPDHVAGTEMEQMEFCKSNALTSRQWASRVVGGTAEGVGKRAEAIRPGLPLRRFCPV